MKARTNVTKVSRKPTKEESRHEEIKAARKEAIKFASESIASHIGAPKQSTNMLSVFPSQEDFNK